jgi:hypothetical protein
MCFNSYDMDGFSNTQDMIKLLLLFIFFNIAAMIICGILFFWGIN